MIYLDTSALLKLVLDEPESEALEGWLAGRPGRPWSCSELVVVEVVRACRRVDDRAVPAVRALLAQLDLVPLDRALLDVAADLPGRHLRSLDAVHLAAAMSLGKALDVFVAYDARLLEAAQDARLPVASPA